MSKWFIRVLALAAVLLAGAYHWLDPETNTLDQAERQRLGGDYVELSDGVTHYALTGPPAGKLVVLVHGATVAMWGWQQQAEALAGAGYRVLSYDHFGRGYSDRPDVVYDRALYLRQLVELLDKLALPEPFDLVGVSFGGATAVNFTAQHPQRVRSLILIAPLVNDFKVPAVFRVPVAGEVAARLVGIDMIVERFAAMLDGAAGSQRYQRLFAEQTTYRGFQRSLLSMVRTDALRDYREAYQRVGQQGRKTLLIWGTADTEINREMMDHVRTSIAETRFEPVSGAGHGVVLQQPQVVNQLMLGFLREGR